jgi:hypothetical protein
MFTLVAEPRWTSTVTVRQPGAAPATFTATFRLVAKDQRDKLGGTLEGTEELMRLSVVTTEDVVNEAGEVMPFTPELLGLLIANPWVLRGLVNAWADGLAGFPGAAATGN